MVPERVDERLDLLADDDDDDDDEEDDEPPPRRKLQDPRAQFLEATKQQPIIQCPLDLDLLDGPVQGGCGMDGAFCVDYALRVRMCERCYKENVVEGTDVLQSLPKQYRERVAQVVLMLIPSAHPFEVADTNGYFHRINPLSHLMQDFYLKSDLEAVLRLFWPLPEPEDVMDLKSSYAFLIYAWDNVHATFQDHTKWLMAYTVIKVLFQESAPIWQLCGPDGAGFAHDPSLSEHLHSNALQPEAEEDPLPPPEVKSHDQLVAEMTAFERRARAAYDRRIAGRYAQMADWYAHILDEHFCGGRWDHDALPNAFDGARLWESLVLDDHARTLLDVDTVMGEQQLEDVVEELQAYPKMVMKCLAAAVRTADGSDIGEDGKELGSRGCDEYPFAWPEINIHWQEKHPEESVWEGSPGKVYRAAVWEGGIPAAEKILAVLVEQGLCERAMNRKHLHTLIKDGRVFCACGDPRMPETRYQGFDWAALVKHVSDSNHLNENACRTVKFVRE
ncbi:hypothetical protein GSI_03229 [Ganoderma sinense ZZ0214-1]|uniref:Uncharacterized protein n=1 Tax=Ganoderma sinense ZZ0214-1 TaxID=1077348 RepID=A0A2G8SL32_9APHY|nr:hypothetical protein GSI_03229 [Ganoderma sinense ZZ0214-1]